MRNGGTKQNSSKTDFVICGHILGKDGGYLCSVQCLVGVEGRVWGGWTAVAGRVAAPVPTMIT